MTLSVAEALERVRVTRIVHFTPAKNLWGIFTDEMIRTSEDLAANADSYCVTDHERLDRRRTHTCCSFEYPNAYYQRKARSKSPLINYPDWVCLILNRELVKRPGTLFAPCNAAKNSGAFLAEGGQAVRDCWANHRYRISTRGGLHTNPPCRPTFRQRYSYLGRSTCQSALP